MKTILTVAFTLFFAYAGMLAVSSSGTETAAQGYWRKNRNVIAAYANTSPKSVVFAGSSLTAAMSFSGVEGCVYNLGLIGESALTGMDVIQAGLWLPSVVFVEVNFPERESNSALIRSAANPLAHHFPDFVYIAPMTFLAQLGSAALQSLRSPPVASSAPAVTEDPVSARAAELALQRGVFEKKLSEPVIRNKLIEFAIKIQQLEASGVKVVLIELPIHPELETTPRAEQIRTTFREVFPSLSTVSTEKLTQGLSVQTVDGLHLTADDSRGVLRNLLPYLQAACSRQTP